MSRTAFAAIFLAIAATGCHQDTATMALQSTSSQLKPSVALVPVINSTQAAVEWNLSDELSSEIFYQLSQSKELAMASPSKVRAAVRKLKEDQNPFGNEIHWIKQAFPNDQFVIFLELTEHEEVLRQERKKPVDPSLCAADLNMSMRVRVFDCSETTPKVILQELIHDSHFVPRPFTTINFYQNSWDDENFSISPLGLAHSQFTKEISTRIRDYILLTQE